MTQAEALDHLKSGKNIALTGEPGAGKTHTINQFTAWLKEQRRQFAITASTGIAATHIGGTTIHSWSGIGLKRIIEPEHIKTMRFNAFLVDRVRSAQVLIIDEISMIDARMINNVDYVLRELRGNEDPFGGIQVVFVGDFFQLPPVVKNEPLHFAFEAESWTAANLKICYLTEQHRQNDPVFLEVLTAMRKGEITAEHRKIIENCRNNPRPETHLYTHNFAVDRENEMNLARLPGKTFVYRANMSGNKYKLEALKKSCLSPEELVLKTGAVVMFTKNNFGRGYVNGTIGKVVSFTPEKQPVVRITDGLTVVPEPAEWTIEEKGVEEARFAQVPLRLAWAITVHKSQGMSLDSASVDLSRTFEYGQGYVAISRVRSLAGLHLQGINDKAFLMHPRVVEQDKIFREESV